MSLWQSTPVAGSRVWGLATCLPKNGPLSEMMLTWSRDAHPNKCIIRALSCLEKYGRTGARRTNFFGQYLREVAAAKDFAGRIAVVTGGGSGMGREFVRQLVAEGCNVAMCDISAAGMAETHRLCETAGLPQGLRLTTHVADVSDAAQVEHFRDEGANCHDTDRVHQLFNNAGIDGGSSMIAHTREAWERTFSIC